jgi:hypothetical protein
VKQTAEGGGCCVRYVHNHVCPSCFVPYRDNFPGGLSHRLDTTLNYQDLSYYQSVMHFCCVAAWLA